MKKNFKYYAIIWGIALVLFNLLCFITPSEVAGVSKFTGTFWVGYLFITLAFVGQLGCGWMAFSQSSREKLFLNLPLISISYTALLVMLVVGGVCMAVPVLPTWLGALLCVLVLAFSAISVTKARAAADIVADVGEKVKTQTLFIRSLTVDAETLLARATSEETRAAAKKVYEAVRYSDPMSNEALAGVEAQITLKFAAFSDAVIAGDVTASDATAAEMLVLLNDRNKKCKLMK